jgi:HK97 family phage major capsid protein
MSKVARGDVSGLVLPDEVSETILRGAAEASLIQQYAKARSMRAQNVQITEAEVTGANVFWVGEGNRKQTDAPPMAQLTWTMSAAELAVIVPLDENVAEDAEVDLFDLYKPAIETAIAQKLDAAALFGTDSPVAWGALGTAIFPNIQTVGNDFEEDASATAAELLDLIAGTGTTPGTPTGALEAVEDAGYEPSGALAYVRFKSRLRGLKDEDLRYIFGDAVSDGVPGQIFGMPIRFAKSDVWDQDNAHLILGDWSQSMVGTRQGIRYKIFDQGVITDGAGAVVYSLMENDMIALRVTARYGFKVIADDTADGETLDGNSEYPFASVRPNTV